MSHNEKHVIVKTQQGLDNCLKNGIDALLHLSNEKETLVIDGKYIKGFRPFGTWTFNKNNKCIEFKNLKNVNMEFDEYIAKKCVFTECKNCDIGFSRNDDELNYVFNECVNSIFATHSASAIVDMRKCKRCDMLVLNSGMLQTFSGMQYCEVIICDNKNVDGDMCGCSNNYKSDIMFKNCTILVNNCSFVINSVCCDVNLVNCLLMKGVSASGKYGLINSYDRNKAFVDENSTLFTEEE